MATGNETERAEDGARGMTERLNDWKGAKLRVQKAMRHASCRAHSSDARCPLLAARPTQDETSARPVCFRWLWLPRRTSPSDRWVGSRGMTV